MEESIGRVACERLKARSVNTRVGREFTAGIIDVEEGGWQVKHEPNAWTGKEIGT